MSNSHGPSTARATEGRGHACGDDTPPIAGVVFDFDGVLVDSLAVHRESWMLAFHEVLGCDLPQVPKEEIAGKSTYEIGAAFCRYAGAPERGREVAEAKIRILESKALLPEALPGAAEVTEALRMRGIPYGIASNAPGSYVRRVAETLSLNPQVALGFEDVRSPKPDPGAYITCAQRLGFSEVDRGRILVCEDSVPGLKAALSAGMRTLAVTTTAHAGQLKRLGAEIIADNLLAAVQHIDVFQKPS